jgi:hypothetical protein
MGIKKNLRGLEKGKGAQGKSKVLGNILDF